MHVLAIISTVWIMLGLVNRKIKYVTFQTITISSQSDYLNSKCITPPCARWIVCKIILLQREYMLFCARFVRARQNRQRSSAWVCGQAHQDAHRLPSPWLWWGCFLCYNWNVVSLSGASVQQYKEPFRQLRWMLWHACNMYCMNSCFFCISGAWPLQRCH